MSKLNTLKGRHFPPVEHHFTWKDAALYALGVGLGQDISDPRQLRFVYENGMLALPTMPVILASPGFWIQDPELGIDWKQILHGEQGIELLGALPAEGTIIGQAAVLDVVDKGPDKGAFIFMENRLTDKATGRPIATLTSTVVCRGDGGFGGKAGPVPQPHALPARPADLTWDFQAQKQAALIYRLSGDDNPLHVDPEIARSAGFSEPILHGLCTLGIAGHGLLRNVCDYDPARLRKMNLRFSSPVFPGETIRTEIWHEGAGVCGFRCVVVERGVVAISNGYAEISQV
ncbi:MULTISPECIES: MaoC/PaaZ C-terminal domain-containing protein [unclassified Chelatococcus]|uniref:MaoC/PaaZ C-terminal domain-containing protein n=1 Tax=unclassified Chelatococcus TaxID=2638111 RepID=UPI001BD0AB10|nr:MULTISPECIES: MaoC/PaaZ C-terminal domain-containing protein [unclassified Chelatococcus]CAH1654969.1 3-hydroxyacyl-thioester dehydratase Y [Hyphomicrobiales bacterium]MBS7742716.1 MaoC family dehydratase N-terminal domain-containing protein [Chelatococcus sp. HY11]MBX3542166.1 MaoC family dehydratase N-terminal domain-containing protein [Chelatococcus sp.]MCO5075618.1 MaoC family dehydratase N-terminal domain-containing protein [Chelatococcus sp.]CAH1695183.1 3-hydroxyacyl-thioester dehydr